MANNYLTYLIKLLAWKTGVSDEQAQITYKDEVPTEAVLLTITALDLLRYFNKTAYGKEQPQPTDRPVKRASTIAYMKKAISFYMPRRSRERALQACVLFS
jgi:hypothetical protein